MAAYIESNEVTEEKKQFIAVKLSSEIYGIDIGYVECTDADFVIKDIYNQVNKINKGKLTIIFCRKMNIFNLRYF